MAECPVVCEGIVVVSAMPIETLERAEAFCNKHGIPIREQLGFGIHGRVWVGEYIANSAILAIKVFEKPEFYEVELDVYRRLESHGIYRLCDCKVPQLELADDTYSVIRMTIVRRPFVLDFAGAQLDSPPDFPPEIMMEFMAEKKMQFGDLRWPKVLEILGELETMGIFLTDISPSNISL